jgi:hypothetical protein
MLDYAVVGRAGDGYDSWKEGTDEFRGKACCDECGRDS